MLNIPWAGNGSGASALNCFVSLMMFARLRQAEQPAGNRRRACGLPDPPGVGSEEAGIFRGGNWPQVDWPGLVGVSLAEAPTWLPGGQECGGHRQCGSGQLGLLSAKWRCRHVCHVLVARGRRSHADGEAGGGRGSAGQEAGATQPTATWGPQNCEGQRGLTDRGPHQGGTGPREAGNVRGVFGCRWAGGTIGI